ncbi:MAG: tannase/feruloyl esterase family alpha/beta hydrolase [Betaproteobacteria bacterium]|nr:tannase/feruloyl esterase family alpha/beta hydrolase [Betaproteobacteria bacterium]
MFYVKFTRPICAWPKAANYNGSGLRTDAANWSCG